MDEDNSGGDASVKVIHGATLWNHLLEQQMSKVQSPIVILAKTSNESGDLFAELLTSFFSSVGYEQCRPNIHKSGREIDVDGSHRIEIKRLIAECKATGQKIGGGDVNKFIGALDVERRKSDKEVVGYYVSLNGFTQTAIQQELDAGGGRVLLIDGDAVVRGLSEGRILVAENIAYAAASSCAGTESGLVSDPVFTILAHPLGFIWAIFFTRGKLRTHVAFIHADGTPLHPKLAEELLSFSYFDGSSLKYLPPANQAGLHTTHIAKARSEYLSYIESECGEIQLEGLPADQEVGSRKLRLESIFVPSHLTPLRPDGANQPADIDVLAEEETDVELDPEESSEMPVNANSRQRIPAGTVLLNSKRLAILGLPGSGKSTLLKRLSTAYAFPERMGLVDDSLPTVTRFPIFIRCRQLGSLCAGL